ncbi:MAG: c-type cytochrome [Halieaceae bacterium]|jgi:cytochrome c553|nr:c-type cytochrome [Halieaceae bacterium]
MPDSSAPRLYSAVFAALLFSAVQGFAAAAPSADDDFGYCLVCHGSDAAGNRAIGAPNLTALSAWYLESQLHAFQRGERGWHADDHAGQSMASAARVLESTEAVAAAVQFIGAYPQRVAPATTSGGDAQRGEALYATCAACHGSSGEGKEALKAPALAGQSDWYLVKALEDYRGGRRGAGENPGMGAAMRSAALQLPDAKAVYDVVAYVQGLASPNSAGPSINEQKESDAMNKKSIARGLRSTLPAVALAAASTQAMAQDVTRYPLPGGSTFPIAQAVGVPAGTELLFHSGLLPAPADPDAERGTRAYLGDTYTQTMSVLQRFEASLKEKGMGLGNIIKMNVFLVGDPELDGKMDFAGFMRAYSQFFGTEAQPNLPARAAVQVAGLANGAFVEIEVIAAR